MIWPDELSGEDEDNIEKDEKSGEAEGKAEDDVMEKKGEMADESFGTFVTVGEGIGTARVMVETGDTADGQTDGTEKQRKEQAQKTTAQRTEQVETLGMGGGGKGKG